MFRFVPAGAGRDTIEGYDWTQDRLEFAGFSEVVIVAVSASEARITFGVGDAAGEVVVRGEPGFAFTLGDVAVTGDLTLAGTLGAGLIVGVGVTIEVGGDLRILPPARPDISPGSLDSGDLALSAGGILPAQDRVWSADHGDILAYATRDGLAIEPGFSRSFAGRYADLRLTASGNGNGQTTGSGIATLDPFRVGPQDPAGWNLLAPASSVDFADAASRIDISEIDFRTLSIQTSGPLRAPTASAPTSGGTLSVASAGSTVPAFVAVGAEAETGVSVDLSPLG